MKVAGIIKIPFLALVMALCLWLPFEAHAADGLPAVFDTCATNGANASVPACGTLTDSDYTAKVVYCVQYTVLQAVSALLTNLSGYMQGTVAAAFTLAIAIFGMHTLSGGAGEMKARVPAFALRMGIVALYSYNLGGLVPSIFSVEQELVTLAAKPVTSLPAACPFYSNGQLDPSCVWTPWSQIDGFLGILIGFAPCQLWTDTLAKGLLGIIAAALFSTTIGIGVFLAGIMALVEVVLFIFDVVYVYLMAILVIGFQLAISPLIVPLGIFFYTEKYVTKWLNMLIAAMLTPVLLFAFLALFLGIFNVFISQYIDCTRGRPVPTLFRPNNLCTCTIDFHYLLENGRADVFLAHACRPQF